MSQDNIGTDVAATLTFTGSVQALSQILAQVQGQISHQMPQKNKIRTKLRLTSVSPGPSLPAVPAAGPSQSAATETSIANPAEIPTDATTEGLTYTHVSEATLRLVAEKGKPAAVAVLESFGVANARELSESQWDAYLAAIVISLKD